MRFTGDRRPIERLSLRIADRISKRDWQMFGGFSNPRLARVTRGGAWAYFWLHR
jgi:hypothetical protein